MGAKYILPWKKHSGLRKAIPCLPPFRLLKFAFIGLAAALGFYGFLLGILVLLIHLAQLESFGIPYLMPVVGAELSGYGRWSSPSASYFAIINATEIMLVLHYRTLPQTS